MVGMFAKFSSATALASAKAFCVRVLRSFLVGLGFRV